jgi:hypothetical protein
LQVDVSLEITLAKPFGVGAWNLELTKSVFMAWTLLAKIGDPANLPLARRGPVDLCAAENRRAAVT